jgi:hypothetical protein
MKQRGRRRCSDHMWLLRKKWSKSSGREGWHRDVTMLEVQGQKMGEG